MSRTRRTSKRQRRFAATCRTLNQFRRPYDENEDTGDSNAVVLEEWMWASGGPV